MKYVRRGLGRERAKNKAKKKKNGEKERGRRRYFSTANLVFLLANWACLSGRKKRTEGK